MLGESLNGDEQVHMLTDCNGIVANRRHDAISDFGFHVWQCPVAFLYKDQHEKDCY